MPKLFYSQMAAGFFAEEIHGDRVPPDAVEISQDAYDALMRAQSDGMQIVANTDGTPVALPRTYSLAERAATARVQRDGALAATDWIVARHRDEMEAGDVLTLHPEQYAALQTYRQALRNITSQPGFPDVTLPAAPDFIA